MGADVSGATLGNGFSNGCHMGISARDMFASRLSICFMYAAVNTLLV
jgi:hypothetical protein